MTRHLFLLAGLCLAGLRLAAVQIDPNSWYRAVVAQDKPAGWSEGNWEFYINGLRQLPDTKIEGNSVIRVMPKTSGKLLLEYLDPNTPFNQFIPSRLVSAEKIPSPGEEAKAELDAKLKAQANQGNGPLTEADMNGKPVKSTREDPFADDDTPVMKGTKKAKPATKPDDFPEKEDKRPLSQRIMNTGKKPAPTAAVAPAARADDEADEPPLAAIGSKFSKPKPGQGTKKDDTLFKNQNQNNASPFQAPNNFIGIWAYPKDRGTGNDDYRLVLVQLTGKDKPDLMTLKNAKRAGYVPESQRYTTLSVYPE